MKVWMMVLLCVYSMSGYTQKLEDFAQTPPMGGMKSLADHIHDLGLKFGIYSCAGSLTCQGRSGRRGYQWQDVRQYAAWGVNLPNKITGAGIYGGIKILEQRPGLLKQKFHDMEY